MVRLMYITSTTCNPDISIVRVVFNFYPQIGGSITHTMELSKNIDPLLKNQVIIAPYFGDKCEDFDRNFGVKILRVKYYNAKKRCNIPVIPLIYITYGINVFFKLRKMQRPDIIHAHGISNIAVCCVISKLLGIPVVGMLHGSLGGYSKTSDLYETTLAKLFRPSCAFILDDGSMAPQKFKRLWGSRAVTVNHGIDTNFFKPVSKNNKLKSQLGLKNSDFIVTSTSSLTAVKNVDLAIKSFKLFLDRLKVANAYLLIVGDGPLKDTLINLTKEFHVDTNVKFVGNVSNEAVIDYLSISDVVIATSLYSNMNLSVQEAMACGKSVITFDSGGTSKLIKDNVNGLLVKSGDISNFAEKLLFLYKNPTFQKKIMENARNFVIHERSWDQRIKKELEVYNELLKRN